MVMILLLAETDGGGGGGGGGVLDCSGSGKTTGVGAVFVSFASLFGGACKTASVSGERGGAPHPPHPSGAVHESDVSSSSSSSSASSSSSSASSSASSSSSPVVEGVRVSACPVHIIEGAARRFRKGESSSSSSSEEATQEDGAGGTNGKAPPVEAFRAFFTFFENTAGLDNRVDARHPVGLCTLESS
jgi:hypothetical protein